MSTSDAQRKEDEFFSRIAQGWEGRQTWDLLFFVKSSHKQCISSLGYWTTPQVFIKFSGRMGARSKSRRSERGSSGRLRPEVVVRPAAGAEGQEAAGVGRGSQTQEPSSDHRQRRSWFPRPGRSSVEPSRWVDPTLSFFIKWCCFHGCSCSSAVEVRGRGFAYCRVSGFLSFYLLSCAAFKLVTLTEVQHCFSFSLIK